MAQIEYKTHTSPFLLRLTPDQRERLKKAAKHLGKSMSDFIRDSVMIHISTVEDDVHEVDDREKRAFVPKSNGINKSAFVLGMESRRRPIEEPVVEPQTAPPSAPPTVVIQQVPSPNDSIDRLANYVLSAPNTVEKEVRSHTVEKILRESARDDEELQRMAGQLDEKIAARSPKKPSLWSMITGK